MEGNGQVLFLTCNAESLLHRHYKRLGELIVNSILQEGPGFSRLPKAVYYYFVGGLEIAIPHLTVEELPMASEHVIKKVSLL